MRKLVSLIILLALAVAVFSCKGGNKNMTTQELSNAMTEKLEERVELSAEQKAKIVELTEASGVLKDGVRTSEDKAKYKALRQRIYNEVLTPEQQAMVGSSGE